MHLSNYGGCGTGIGDSFSWDISKLGYVRSGVVTVEICRVRRIWPGENIDACGYANSRLYTIDS